MSWHNVVYKHQLENPGVQVTSATVETQGGQQNMLSTFWMSSDVDLSRGLDFSFRGPVYARFTHLNHRPFQYVWVPQLSFNYSGSGIAEFQIPTFEMQKPELRFRSRWNHIKRDCHMVVAFIYFFFFFYFHWTRVGPETVCQIDVPKTTRACLWPLGNEATGNPHRKTSAITYLFLLMLRIIPR